MFVAILAILPLATANPYPRSSATLTEYFCGAAATFYGTNGYWLNTTQAGPSSSVLLHKASGVSETAYWGWRVWIVYANNATREISGGSPVAVVSRSTNTAGIQSATWQPSTYDFNATNVDATAIVLKLYMKYSDDVDYTLKAAFTTSHLPYRALLNQTWTISAYTTRAYGGGDLDSTFQWGTGTYNSRVSGMQFSSMDAWESTWRKVRDGNIIGGILEPIVYFIGPILYGLLAFAVSVGLYVRTESFTSILIWLILLGGAGGTILAPIMPALGFQLAMVFCTIGLAGLITKVIYDFSKN